MFIHLHLYNLETVLNLLSNHFLHQNPSCSTTRPFPLHTLAIHLLNITYSIKAIQYYTLFINIITVQYYILQLLIITYL